MLAYVFWHWKQTVVQSRVYEEFLASFHRALKETPSDGFKHSWASAFDKAPWVNNGEPAYEDWYVITGSAALDPLDAAAVSAARKRTHDEAASRAKGGTAGLYRLRKGDEVVAPAIAQWFDKPKGWSYEQLYEELREIISFGDRALWGRQMTFGPAREFCLHAREPVALPGTIDALTIKLRNVFPEGA